jgi:hypothetical protein
MAKILRKPMASARSRLMDKLRCCMIYSRIESIEPSGILREKNNMRHPHPTMNNYLAASVPTRVAASSETRKNWILRFSR